MTIDEEWRPIKGYEDYYAVSNHGRVKALMTNQWRKEGKVLKPASDGWGYLRIGLSVNDVHSTRTIHRLVAQAFIPNSDNKPQVNHIDCNPANNRVDNLEWCTNGENVIHSFKMQRRSSKGSNNANTKLTELDAINIRHCRGYGNKKLVCEAWSVSKYVVADIWERRTWTHV